MSYKKLRPLTESGVLTAVAVVFALIGTYLPFVGVFANLLWPVPIAVLGVRHGYKWSVMATAIAALLIAALIHPLHAVTIAIGLGLVGIVFGHSFRVKHSPLKAMAYGTIACLVSNVAVVLIGAVITGINPLGDLDQLKNIMNEVVGFYQQLGIKGKQLDDFKKVFDSAAVLLQVALPAMLLVSSIMNAAMNFWLIRKVLKRFGQTIPGFPAFSRWEVPKAVVWLLSGSFALLWLAESQGLGLTKNIAINLMIVSSMAMFVQGAALLWFVFVKFGVNKLFRAIIMLFIMFNGMFTLLLVLAGVFESVFEYRRKSDARK